MSDERLEPQDRERRWLARELHDETLQGLGGVRVLLSSARGHADPAALASAVDDAIEMLTEEIQKLRDLIVDLRPAELDDIGLEAAIEKLRRRADLLGGPRVTTNVRLGYEMGTDTTRLSPEIETAAYRIVQEALINAIKHSGASSVQIRVAESDGELEVEVTDDGRGFDGEEAPGHFGIVGMRERAALVSGTLELESSNRGTTVRFVAPVRHLAG